jgi:hypothetical protein
MSEAGSVVAWLLAVVVAAGASTGFAYLLLRIVFGSVVRVDADGIHLREWSAWRRIDFCTIREIEIGSSCIRIRLRGGRKETITLRRSSAAIGRRERANQAAQDAIVAALRASRGDVRIVLAR